jgi:hypothetical protein
MNHRRVLLICARLLAFAAIAQAVAFGIFSRSISTPIERHYLSAYFWSSLPIIGPSTVEVRLIWKTGRHRKQQLATDDDTVGCADGARTVLSQSARSAGWRSLIEGPPQQVQAELLSQDLAGLAFEGQSLWDLLFLPELSALAALCTALCTWYLLIGFFRALPAEFAWRQRYSALEELFSSFFEVSKALARGVRAGINALHRSEGRRIDMHSAAPQTNIAQTPPLAPTPSFALPIFGVYSGTGKGYLWTDRDAIE